MKRLGAFLRSVIPADPTQLIFLAGVVLLFVSPRVSWRPSKLLQSSDFFGGTAKGESSLLWLRQLIPFCLYPVIFGGVAGYFLCLWPSKKTASRILWTVCLPSVVGLGLFVWLTFVFIRAPASVLDRRGSFAEAFNWFSQSVWRFPSGWFICAIGLLLILVFMVLVVRGVSPLPLALPKSDGRTHDESEVWSRVRLLVFVLIGPYFLLSSLVGVLIGLSLVSLRTGSPSVMEVFQRISPVLEGVLLVCVAFLILGRFRKSLMRSSFRTPHLVYLPIAILLSVAATWTVPAGEYVIDRIQWAAHFYGKISPPEPSQYFNPSNAWQPWLLLMIFAALAEEIIFRGMVLPSFIDRYGFYRGIFLTGITWAAVHFRSDIYSGLYVGGVLVHLANRIFLCLALNYVLAWLTLRQGSIIPAAIAHAVWNILASVLSDSTDGWEAEVRGALVVIIAYVLFRFWPVSAEKDDPSGDRDAIPVPEIGQA
jgi:membrane protease YdiL (CAAX protease family)